MDEYNRGMDPRLKRYFRKITRSFSAALLWLLSVATMGLFFQWAFTGKGFGWRQVIFYSLSLAGLIMLLVYLYRQWGGNDRSRKDQEL